MLKQWAITIFYREPNLIPSTISFIFHSHPHLSNCMMYWEFMYCYLLHKNIVICFAHSVYKNV